MHTLYSCKATTPPQQNEPQLSLSRTHILHLTIASLLSLQRNLDKRLRSSQQVIAAQPLHCLSQSGPHTARR